MKMVFNIKNIVTSFKKYYIITLLATLEIWLKVVNWIIKGESFSAISFFFFLFFFSFFEKEDEISLAIKPEG